MNDTASGSCELKQTGLFDFWTSVCHILFTISSVITFSLLWPGFTSGFGTDPQLLGLEGYQK